MKNGLFVGLMTLDLLYRVAQPPKANQKIVASDYLLSAGGPATNAAVAFTSLGKALGHHATVLGVLGQHPMTHLIRSDLEEWDVAIADLAPYRSEPPPVSSIIVTEATGDRAVVSINAVKTQVTAASIPAGIWQDVGIVLIDGHQMAVGQAIAQQAKAEGIPVVIDGGSWKPGFETVLALADYAVVSANFHPPDCDSPEAVLAYLSALGIPHIAMTHGEKPIQFWNNGRANQVPVPAVSAIDTLGAGDILHGAFCHAILREDFVSALTTAAAIAARSCQTFGTRRWMA